MNFDAQARRQAKNLIDAFTDTLIKELAQTAQQEADAAATQARAETQQAAAEQLAAARAEADQRLQAELATLRAEGEQRLRAELATARAEAEARLTAAVASTREDGEAKLAAAQATNAALAESVEAARRELEKAKAAAQHELEGTRRELQRKVDQLLEECNRALQERDEAARSLEVESNRVMELAERVEAELRHANELGQRVEAETRRANDLSQRLEAETRRVNELSHRRQTDVKRAGNEAPAPDPGAALDRTAAALRSIDEAATAAEILEALLAPLAADFSRAAVFLVANSSLKGWKVRGVDEANDITKVAIPRGSDSPLVRAVAERQPVAIAASGGESPTGLWGSPVARMVALPVYAGDRVIAVAYAEDNNPPAAGVFPGPGCKIVEMLIGHAALRLGIKDQSTSGSAGGGRTSDALPGKTTASAAARQAPRLMMPEGIELSVDGTSTPLIDVSAIGAQFLSPQTMRPNKMLRLIFRLGEKSLVCKARVMWARFEQGRGREVPHYRVGVKFTDVDRKTVEAFLSGLADENRGHAASSSS